MTVSRDSLKSVADSGVVITRRRWDWYFLAGTTAAAFAGAVAAWLLDRWQMLGTPLFILPIWLFVRTLWPKEGRRVPTLLGTPGAVPMLAWGTFILALAGMLSWMDTLFLGHAFRDPLEWYHYVAWGLIFGLQIAGVAVIERKLPRPRQRSKKLDSREPSGQS